MTGTPNEDKGISRIDSGSTRGWFVRGYRNGKTYAKLFSDAKLGGKDQSLIRARKYRDKLHQRLNDVKKKSRKRRITFRDRRNKTGVLGVSRASKKDPYGKTHEVYSVSWRPRPGVQKCTSFSIKKYGEEKALELAIAHRLKMMNKSYTREELNTMKKNAAKVDNKTTGDI